MVQGRLRIPLAALPPSWNKCQLELLNECAQLLVGINGELEHCIPLAWDASLEIHDGQVVIEGGVGCSGFGEVTIKLPQDKADNFYEMWIDCFRQGEYEKYVQILKSHDIKWTEDLNG